MRKMCWLSLKEPNDSVFGGSCPSSQAEGILKESVSGMTEKQRGFSMI